MSQKEGESVSARRRELNISASAAVTRKIEFYLLNNEF